MQGLQTLLIGIHNPILHGFLVFLAWKKIYHKCPSFKETICILLHDIGYIKEKNPQNNDDRHPEIGARLCGSLFGLDYQILCLAHSRVYAERLGVPLSRLGYADKYSVLLIPDFLYNVLLHIGGDVAEYHATTKTKKWGYPFDVEILKEEYRKWWEKNRDKVNSSYLYL